MLAVTGTPYDTIHDVIGISGSGMGSLKDFGIVYDEVPLKNEKPDLEAIENAVDDSVTMVYIQRSRGYELRPSLLVDEIGEIVKVPKRKIPMLSLWLITVTANLCKQKNPPRWEQI